MRVLLIADVGTNTEGFYHVGDEAMLYQMVQRYRQEQPQTKLGLLSRSISHQALPVKEFLHLPFPTADIWLRSLVYCLKLMVFCVVKRLTKHDFFKPQERKFLATLDRYQVFHFTGGGNIYSHHAPWLYYVFFLIWYGWWTKKPIWLTSQTIGPFNWFDGWVAKLFLRLSTIIVLRGQSTPLPWKTFVGLDAAYDLPKQNRPVLPRKSSKTIRIGLSLHEWHHFGPQVTQVVAQALSQLSQSHQIEVVLLPHVFTRDSKTWDPGFMSQLTTQLSSKIKVISIRPQTIQSAAEPVVFVKTATAELDLLIATRYHGLVFALSSDVPVITFRLDDYYDEKNQQLLALVYQKNWQRFVLDLQVVDIAKQLRRAIVSLHKSLANEKELLKKENKRLFQDKQLFQMSKLLTSNNSQF